MDTLKFTIPGKPEYLTMVRLAVSSIASEAGFDIDSIEDVTTAVTEACKNVSCHGTGGFSEQYEIVCGVDSHRIEITVKDDCTFHELEKIPVPCQKCPQECDLGVFVIESLVDEVALSNDEYGRKMIRMVKY